MAAVDIRSNDLSLTDVVMDFYFWYLNVLFPINTVLFGVVMFIMHSLSSHSKLTEYRLCLLANTISVYLFEVSVFVSKPSIVPRGGIVICDGVVTRIAPKAGYVALYFAFMLLIAHLLATGISMAYQYNAAMSAASSRLDSVLNNLIKLIFR